MSNKIINNVKGFDKYTLSSDGSVSRFGKILKTSLSSGYPKVTLKQNGLVKHYRIHRLLAEHFLPNPSNLKEVNHKDGNRQNFSLDNLEWCTRSENENHAAKFLGKKYKPPSPESNFKPVVRSDGVSYKSVTEAARMNSRTVSSISMVLSGHNKTCNGFKFSYAV